MNSPDHRERSRVMNAETAVKFIKGVCLLIIHRPSATRVGRLFAEKVLVEGDSPGNDAIYPKVVPKVALTYLQMLLDWEETGIKIVLEGGQNR